MAGFLATLLYELYNFAHWLTQNRDEAEDLVRRDRQYFRALGLI
jgi:DNA-directed RNA polymerase specialized sigma24 family protein